jgi:hypothetical protein
MLSHCATSALAGRKKHYAAAAAVAVVILVLLFQTLRKAYRPQGYDFTSYLLSAQALLEKRNPYLVETHFPYIYPLFLAFVVSPLTILPYGVASVFWFLLSVGALLLSVRGLIDAAPTQTNTSWGWHLAVPGLTLFLITFSAIQNNLLNGQVNLLMLACCVVFFTRFTDNKSVGCAVGLGCAIALKLLPAILLGFLVLRRRLRCAIYAVLATVLFCLLPGLIDRRDLFVWYGTYIHQFLIPKLTATGGQAGGFNLQGLLACFSPPLGQSPFVRVASFIASVSAVLAVDLATVRSRSVQAQVWAFCAYLIGALFLSPMAETHHLVLAIPAIVLLGTKAVFDDSWRTKGVKVLLGSFVASFTILPQLFDAASFYFIPLCILIVLLFVAAQRPACGSSRVPVEAPHQ